MVLNFFPSPGGCKKSFVIWQKFCDYGRDHCETFSELVHINDFKGLWVSKMRPLKKARIRLIQKNLEAHKKSILRVSNTFCINPLYIDIHFLRHKLYSCKFSVVKISIPNWMGISNFLYVKKKGISFMIFVCKSLQQIRSIPNYFQNRKTTSQPETQTNINYIWGAWCAIFPSFHPS